MKRPWRLLQRGQLSQERRLLRSYKLSDELPGACSLLLPLQFIPPHPEHCLYHLDNILT